MIIYSYERFLYWDYSFWLGYPDLRLIHQYTSNTSTFFNTKYVVLICWVSPRYRVKLSISKGNGLQWSEVWDDWCVTFRETNENPLSIRYMKEPLFPKRIDRCVSQVYWYLTNRCLCCNLIIVTAALRMFAADVYVRTRLCWATPGVWLSAMVQGIFNEFPINLQVDSRYIKEPSFLSRVIDTNTCSNMCLWYGIRRTDTDTRKIGVFVTVSVDGLRMSVVVSISNIRVFWRKTRIRTCQRRNIHTCAPVGSGLHCARFRLTHVILGSAEVQIQTWILKPQKRTRTKNIIHHVTTLEARRGSVWVIHLRFNSAPRTKTQC